MKNEKELADLKEQLSAQFKPLYTVTVPLNDDETEFATIYLKKFDRNTLAVVQKLSNGPDPLKAVETFMKNCYVGGDDIKLITENLDALLSCNSILGQLLTVKQCELKKNQLPIEKFFQKKKISLTNKMLFLDFI